MSKETIDFMTLADDADIASLPIYSRNYNVANHVNQKKQKNIEIYALLLIIPHTHNYTANRILFTACIYFNQNENDKMRI